MPVISPVTRLSAPQSPARPVPPDRVEVLYGSDSHAGYAMLDRFVRQANTERPDMVLLGGDMVEKGTAPEHALTKAGLDALQVPYQVIPGNHDYKLDEAGRFGADFGKMPKSYDLKGVHFVMIDDADQSISEETFAFLAKDLAANPGKPTVVAMHVPATWQDTSSWTKAIRAVAGSKAAAPAVKDPAQAKRFEALMAENHVGLVISGHTHIPADNTVDGVRYITVGTLGGKLIQPGTNHEYLRIEFQNGKFDVTHVDLDNPVTGMANVVASDLSYNIRLGEAVDASKTNGDAIAKTEGPSGMTGLWQDLQEQAADVVVAGSANSTLSKLGYAAYGALTKPRQDSAEIANIAAVTPTLLRGGQPTESGFAALKRQGVATVINLRPEANWEGPMVAKQGMRYLYQPLPAVGEPTMEQATKFLSTVTDPANGKVFLHCQHGADRTGAMVAAYRIAAQGWTADAAIAEMYEHGFHAGFENDKLDFVRKFARDWQAMPTAQKAQILHRQGLKLTA